MRADWSPADSGASCFSKRPLFEKLGAVQTPFTRCHCLRHAEFDAIGGLEAIDVELEEFQNPLRPSAAMTTQSASRPWRKAFCDERFFPSGLEGPWGDLASLARDAVIRLRELITLQR
jgi:hypothetical protein